MACDESSRDGLTSSKLITAGEMTPTYTIHFSCFLARWLLFSFCSLDTKDHREAYLSPTVKSKCLVSTSAPAPHSRPRSVTLALLLSMIGSWSLEPQGESEKMASVCLYKHI
jgi:hypothetical protein